jgi:pimeloyl-ACP methyl ester carboxylesterase
MIATRRVRSGDGTELAVFESGVASGPVVVAVHGYPDDHAVWDGMAAQLGDDFRVITYDVRGVGGSERPADRAAYRMPLLVDDLRAVLDAVSPVREVHLFGHDWGSVQLWAAVADDRLAGRVAGFTSVSGPSLEQTAAWLRRGNRYPRAVARQLADSWYTAAFRLPWLPEVAIRAGLLERVVGPRERGNLLAGLNLYRANLGGLSRSRAREVRVPVQVLAPRSDRFVTTELATEAPRPYVRDLRTHVIDGGHWVVRSRPDVIAHHVREFVRLTT